MIAGALDIPSLAIGDFVSVVGISSLEFDSVLKPMVDAGYSRNDNPLTAPITVDPVRGYDPAAITAPITQGAYGGAADPVSQILSGYLDVFKNLG